MTRNNSVPMPENSSVVEGGKPVSSGTRKVAPNMAITCCAPMPMVSGQASRSSGRTIASGATERPSPCRVQRNMVLPGVRSEGAGGARGRAGTRCSAAGEGLAPGGLRADVGDAVEQGDAGAVAGAEVGEQPGDVRGAELVAHRGGHGEHERGGEADREGGTAGDQPGARGHRQRVHDDVEEADD